MSYEIDLTKPIEVMGEMNHLFHRTPGFCLIPSICNARIEFEPYRQLFEESPRIKLEHGVMLHYLRLCADMLDFCHADVDGSCDYCQSNSDDDCLLEDEEELKAQVTELIIEYEKSAPIEIRLKSIGIETMDGRSLNGGEIA
jgi:hypothetical protein